MGQLILLEPSYPEGQKVVRELRYSQLIPDWLAVAKQVIPRLHWKDIQVLPNSSDKENSMLLSTQQLNEKRAEDNKKVLQDYRLPVKLTLPPKIKPFKLLEFKPLTPKKEGPDAK